MKVFHPVDFVMRRKPLFLGLILACFVAGFSGARIIDLYRPNSDAVIIEDAPVITVSSSEVDYISVPLATDLETISTVEVPKTADTGKLTATEIGLVGFGVIMAFLGVLLIFSRSTYRD